MSKPSHPFLSVVVPVYNEAQVISQFHMELSGQLKSLKKSYEIIYVDDGSVDDSYQKLKLFRQSDAGHIRLIKLSRNFGKETATTAGIQQACGKTTILLDADGQHPVSYIPQFIAAWEQGAKVVVGVRQDEAHEFLAKRLSSRLFYAVFNRITGTRLQPGSTDFRLIDTQVREQFARLSERNRLTRGLIDWLGYTPTYVVFNAAERSGGNRSYSYRKLTKLAIDSMVSLSSSPLYIAAFAGVGIMILAFLLGIAMITNALLGDPVGLRAVGGAYVLVLILFLVGLMLTSQGIIGLYLSHIHAETQNRPLYIVEETI